MMRTQFSGQRFFVFPATKRHGFKSHFSRVLNAEMSESADALDGHNITGAGSGIAQRIENSDACAHERPRFFGWKFVRDPRQRFRRRDHVLGVTAIKIDPRDLAINAHSEIAATALVTHKIMAAVPADADALVSFPVRHVISQGIDAPRNFMSWHTWILQPRPQTVFDQDIAMANAARVHFHPNLSCARLG